MRFSLRAIAMILPFSPCCAIDATPLLIATFSSFHYCHWLPHFAVDAAATGFHYAIDAPLSPPLFSLPRRQLHFIDYAIIDEPLPLH